MKDKLQRLVRHVCSENKTCTCSMHALEPDDECPVHGAGPCPPRCGKCGRFIHRPNAHADGSAVADTVDMIKLLKGESEMNGWWTITHDALADEAKPKASPTNAVTLCGPRECTLTFDEILRHPDAKKFQMLDDDGNLYYQGMCILPEGLSDEAFRPLDDFGMPNAGATIIQYRNDERGEWETL